MKIQPRYSLYSILLILLSCVNDTVTDPKSSVEVEKTIKTSSSEVVKSNNPIIYIIPLGDVPIAQLNFVQQSVIDFFHFQVVINPKQSLSSDLKNSPKGRYVADKILKKYNSKLNTLLLTNVDIVTHNKERGVKEWGVFGLGYRPGKTCVVSTYKLSRTKVKVSNEKFLERIKKICIHEIGHNLGLDHCTSNRQCLMNDARCHISQVDMETLDFCQSCKKKIGMGEK
jgi:archaemetzincin